MDLKPSEIRRKTFTLMRRGFDPQEVGSFLEKLSEHVADLADRAETAESGVQRLESELQDARSAEEAVRLTMVAATQAKEEMLSTAQAEANELRKRARLESEQLREAAQRESEQLRHAARQESEQVRDAAQRDADATLTSSRREALEVLEISRREAEELVAGARDEQVRLRSQVEHLRTMVTAAREALTQLSVAALDKLDTIDQAVATAQTTQVSSSHEETTVAPRPEVEPSELSEVSFAVEDETGVTEQPAMAAVVPLPDAVDRLLEQLRNGEAG